MARFYDPAESWIWNWSTLDAQLRISVRPVEMYYRPAGNRVTTGEVDGIITPPPDATFYHHQFPDGHELIGHIARTSTALKSFLRVANVPRVFRNINIGDHQMLLCAPGVNPLRGLTANIGAKVFGVTLAVFPQADNPNQFPVDMAVTWQRSLGMSLTEYLGGAPVAPPTPATIPYLSTTLLVFLKGDL